MSVRFSRSWEGRQALQLCSALPGESSQLRLGGGQLGLEREHLLRQPLNLVPRLRQLVLLHVQ
eukprot:3433082-Rhodomonas_salina.1